MKPRNEWRPRFWSMNIVQKALEMRKNGMSDAEICRSLRPDCTDIKTEVEHFQRAAWRFVNWNPPDKEVSKKCMCCKASFKTLNKNQRMCAPCGHHASGLSRQMST